MKVHLEKIGGEIVKDTDVYCIEDNNFLDNLTLSRTILKPGMMTIGHSHENEEEVYIFNEGSALIMIGDDFFHANPKDVFLIPKGKFHRVINKSEHNNCSFTCIFEKYDRKGKTAKYKNQ